MSPSPPVAKGAAQHDRETSGNLCLPLYIHSLVEENAALLVPLCTRYNARGWGLMTVVSIPQEAGALCQYLP